MKPLSDLVEIGGWVRSDLTDHYCCKTSLSVTTKQTIPAVLKVGQALDETQSTIEVEGN